MRIRYGFNYLVFLIRSDSVFVVMETAGKRVPAPGGSVRRHPGIFRGPDFPALHERSGPDQASVDQTKGGNAQH